MFLQLIQNICENEVKVLLYTSYRTHVGKLVDNFDDLGELTLDLVDENTGELSLAFMLDDIISIQVTSKDDIIILLK